MEEQTGGGAQVIVGTAGWDYPDWKGLVYPRPMRRGVHPLAYLSTFFGAVEVNSTFYRPPRPDYCEKWVKHVQKNKNFLFTIKLWQRFTHERKSVPSEEESRLFRAGIEPIVEAGRLGGLLVQFPWSFKKTEENRGWLERVMDRFEDFPIALEVRHASWNVPETYDLLRNRRAGICNIDQPLFKKSIVPDEKVTARLGYVRLHGQNYKDWFRESATRDERYNYLYKEDELTPWVEKIKRMREHARRIFVITNNHFRGQAAVNGLQLLSKLSGRKVRVPESLLGAYPQLNAISVGKTPGRQGRLPGF